MAADLYVEVVNQQSKWIIAVHLMLQQSEILNEALKPGPIVIAFKIM